MGRVEMLIASRPWSVDGDGDQCVGQGVVAVQFGGLVAITSLLAWTCDVRRGTLRRRSGWGMRKRRIGDEVEQRNRQKDVERIVKGGTYFVDEGRCRESLM